MEMLEYIATVCLEFILNGFAFPIWPDRLVFKILNPFLNIYLLEVVLVWQIIALPRKWHHIKYSGRLYFRRRLISKLLQASPKSRDSILNHLLLCRLRSAYLLDTQSFIGKYYSRFYRYLFHYEIMTLRRLAEAKDLNRELLLLGFIDASRFGSTKTVELHQHLACVLEAWNHQTTTTASLQEKEVTLMPKTNEFSEEIRLIREGEAGRKAQIEDRITDWWLPDPSASNFADDPIFKNDGQDFVEFGPSVERLGWLVECKDAGRWGKNVWPTLMYMGQWGDLVSFFVYVALKGLMIYLACYGYYDLTLELLETWLST